MNECTDRARAGGRRRRRSAASLVLVATLLSPGSLPGTPRAEEAGNTGRSNGFQAGVMELSGTTSLSVDYQKEDRGSGRESTRLRLTPSLGYFILNDFEVLLQVSYILDNLHISSGNNDRSQTLLFALGPSYSFSSLSDRVIPYAGLLFGAYYNHLRQESSGVGQSRGDLQLALGLGAGIRLLFTENLALKAGLQYIHGFEEEFIGSTDFFGLELGISLFIPTWPAS